MAIQKRPPLASFTMPPAMVKSAAIGLAELEAAAAVVYEAMDPTPQHRWPLLDARCGTAVWVKHENHTPVGAFKVRGGLVYFDALAARPDRRSRGWSGRRAAITASPSGLPRRATASPRPWSCRTATASGKNRAMRALGVELIERGHDFQASLEAAAGIAAERGWHAFPSFHPLLVRGVGSYALELLRAAPHLDTLYVPIGLGSGICGAMAARDALGLSTHIVGVVSAGAPAYARSLQRGELVSHEVTTAIADGMACRTPGAGRARVDP